MRRDVLLLLCSICLFPALVQADDDGMSAKDIKTLFFGHDDRKPVSNPTDDPWDAIGQLETASGNLCTATLISPIWRSPPGTVCLRHLKVSQTNPSRCVLSRVKAAGCTKFTVSKVG